MTRANYQEQMTTGVADLDKLGNDAAAEITPENFGAGTREVTKVTDSGMVYKTTASKWGMLPTQVIPLDFASERAAYFDKLSQTTYRSVAPGGGSGKTSAAYRSQVAMMKNYQTDLHRLPDAQRDYNLLVPLANMAARSFAKAQEIGDWTTFNDETDFSSELSGKEQKALRKAMGTEVRRGLDDGNSVALAAQDLMVSRRGLVAASHMLAGALDRIAQRRLQAELDKANADKAAIQAKIAKVAQIVGYVETAGSMIAGGGGFVNSQLPGAPPPIETGPDLRPGGAGTAEKIGGHVATGAGVAGKLAAAGAELYYAGELTRLDAQIKSLEAQIDVTKEDEEYRDIMAARQAFDAAQLGYKAVVEKYQASISDRHKHMAAAGTAADKTVGKQTRHKGNNDHVGESVEWMTTVLELQSFLTTAMDAGVAAQQSVDEVETLVRGHRRTPWGTLADVFGDPSTNTPRSEGMGGPDIKVLRQMRSLTDNWMDSSQHMAQMVNDMISSRVAPTLGDAGFDGKY